MHFAYDGFTHREDRRCFTFRGVDESKSTSVFHIEIDMLLLVENRLPVQDGPVFCLQLLKTACDAGPEFLERFRNYRILAEDFRPYLVERARIAAEKSLKTARRAPYRKPPSTSNLRLGLPSESN